jgi:hypothetical protein
MNTKQLAARVASATVVVLSPIATLSASASASQKVTSPTEAGLSAGLNRDAPNAWASRLSGLPFRGRRSRRRDLSLWRIRFLQRRRRPDRGNAKRPERMAFSSKRPGIRRRRSMSEMAVIGATRQPGTTGA